MFRLSHSRTPSLASMDDESDTEIELYTPPSDRILPRSTPSGNSSVPGVDEIEKEVDLTSEEETSIADATSSSQTTADGEQTSRPQHHRLPRAVYSRSASPPHAPRSGYMWLKIPLNGVQEATRTKPMIATREEAWKGMSDMPARPRHVLSKSTGSLPTLTTTGLFPGFDTQRGTINGKHHRVPGPYASFAGLRPSRVYQTEVSPGAPEVGFPTMKSTRSSAQHQPIPYRYIGPCLPNDLTEGFEKGRKKLLLVGPAIAQHLKAGGGVRVRDFEGSVVGWIR